MKHKLTNPQSDGPGSAHSSEPQPNGAMRPTPANPADHHPESLTVHDPMGENAIYNRPLDATSLMSKESPIQDASALNQEPDPTYVRPPTINSHSSSSRASSENRGRSGEYPRSLTSNGFNVGSSSGNAKRMPKKLTKNRGASESSVERPSGIGPPPIAVQPQQQPTLERAHTEKPRGVLTKRVPQRQSTNASNDGGQQGPPAK